MKRYIIIILAVMMTSVYAATGVVAAATNALSNTVSSVATTNAANVAGKTATAAQNTFWKQYGTLIIWVVVIGSLFAFLWSKGYLVRIRNFVEETREELRKCTWPSVEELKGSTVVVMLTIAILGAFTVGVDWVLATVMRLITA